MNIQLQLRQRGHNPKKHWRRQADRALRNLGQLMAYEMEAPHDPILQQPYQKFALRWVKARKKLEKFNYNRAIAKLKYRENGYKIRKGI